MLVGKRVVLRTVRESDLDHLYELMADVRAMGDYWTPNIESEIKRRKQIEESGDWQEDRGLLLITNHADRILGQIFFFRPASYLNAFELAYRIYEAENWGQGYTSEAVSLLVAYLFETQTVSRIQATTLPDNRGSQGVLKKCGFQFEGVMRQAIFHRGQAQDLHLFAIVRGEQQPLAELLAPLQPESPARE